jgi:hypothetical protein
VTRIAGNTTTVLLGATVLRLWHLLLLRQSLNAPWVVAGWLVLTLALFLASWRLALRVPADHRNALERLLGRTDGTGTAFLVFFLCLLFLFHWGYERAASDGREYYVQVRSLVIDRDLNFANDNATFGVRGTAARYAFGAPVLWAPFFVLCHLWLAWLNVLGGSFVLDGFVSPYQRAAGLGSLVYGFLGFVLVYRVLKDYFARRLSLAVTLLVCCGSFYVWYLTVENSMVHGVALFATTLFLYLWHVTRSGRTRGQWALIGAAAGLMSMVRWQNALFLVVPMGHALWQALRADRSPAGLRRLAVDAGVFVAGLLAAFSPQLVFWKVVRGEWISPPAAEHGVHLGTPHVADVLFSPYHGLFSATPLLYLAMLGFPLFVRRDRLLAAVLAAGFVGQLYINASIEAWWGGAGFGARRFESCALAFAVGLASLLAWAQRRPMAAPAAILGALLALNTTFMLDLKRGILPADEGITFDRMHDTLYRRLGNPFSLPWNAFLGWKHDIGLPVYDKLLGRSYNNLTIDLGEDDDERFLGGGWAARERAPGGSFRWATGHESVVVAPLKEDADDYRIELKCAPFRYPGAATAQAVTVLVNGREVGRLVLGDAPATYSVDVPSAALDAGLNQVRLRHAYAMSPAETGMSADRRVLSVQYDSIRLTRVTGTGR